MNPNRMASDCVPFSGLSNSASAVAARISCNWAGDHSSFLLMALARTNPARSLFVARDLAGDAIERTGGKS